MAEDSDKDFVERRANTMRLDPEHATMLKEVHLLLTDEHVGVCTRMRNLEKTVNGNGKPGLAEQVRTLESRNMKHSAAIATAVTFAGAGLWEYFKFKLGWK